MTKTTYKREFNWIKGLRGLESMTEEWRHSKGWLEQHWELMSWSTNRRHWEWCLSLEISKPAPVTNLQQGHKFMGTVLIQITGTLAKSSWIYKLQVSMREYLSKKIMWVASKEWMIPKVDLWLPCCFFRQPEFSSQDSFQMTHKYP